MWNRSPWALLRTRQLKRMCASEIVFKTLCVVLLCTAYPQDLPSCLMGFLVSWGRGRLFLFKYLLSLGMLLVSRHCYMVLHLLPLNLLFWSKFSNGPTFLLLLFSPRRPMKNPRLGCNSPMWRHLLNSRSPWNGSLLLCSLLKDLFLIS